MGVCRENPGVIDVPSQRLGKEPDVAQHRSSEANPHSNSTTNSKSTQQLHIHKAAVGPLLVAPSSAVAAEMLDVFSKMRAVVASEQQQQQTVQYTPEIWSAAHRSYSAPATANAAADTAAEVVTWAEHFKPLLLDLQSIMNYTSDTCNTRCCNSCSTLDPWTSTSGSAASQLPFPDLCGHAAHSKGTGAAAAAAAAAVAEEKVFGQTLVTLLQYFSMHQCWCTMSWLLAEAYQSGLLHSPDVLAVIQSWHCSILQQQPQQQQQDALQKGASIAAALTAGLFDAVSTAAAVPRSHNSKIGSGSTGSSNSGNSNNSSRLGGANIVATCNSASCTEAAASPTTARGNSPTVTIAGTSRWAHQKAALHSPRMSLVSVMLTVTAVFPVLLHLLLLPSTPVSCMFHCVLLVLSVVQWTFD